jgi:tryptophan 2,3-dioxygenase
MSIRFADSKKDSLIQLADIVAGAIARSYKDKADAWKYKELLENKIISVEEIAL